MPKTSVPTTQISWNGGKTRLTFKRLGNGWDWLKGGRARDELYNLRNEPVAKPKKPTAEQEDLYEWWESYRKTMKNPMEDNSESSDEEDLSDIEGEKVDFVLLQKGKVKVRVGIKIKDDGEAELVTSQQVPTWQKVRDLLEKGYNFNESEEDAGLIDAINNALEKQVLPAPNIITKKRKYGAAIEESVINRHWAGNLDESEMEGIRNAKLPGEYKYVPEAMDIDSVDQETRGSIENKKNKALAKMLAEESKGTGEDTIFNEKGKWVTYNWDRKTTRDRGLRSYNKVYKPWQTLAAKVATDPKGQYQPLVKSINDNLKIIDVELRRYYRDFKSVNRATSPSLVAALQTALEGTKTYSVFDLFSQFIKRVTADMDGDEIVAFAKLFSNDRDDMIYHIRQFNISSEFQLRNDLKNNALHPLRSRLPASMSEKDKESVFTPLVQLRLERHQANITMGKLMQRRKQNNPISFMASDLFAFANDLIASTNVHDKILLVQLCTGARWIEVVKVSQFYLTHQTNWKNANKNPISTYHGHDPQRDIVVVGVAKVRRNKKSNQAAAQEEEKKGDEEEKKEEGEVADAEYDSQDADQDVDDNSKKLTDTDSKRMLAPKPVMFIKPEEVQHLVYNLIRPWFRSRMRDQDPTYDDASNQMLTTSYNKLTNARLKTYSITSRPEDMARVHTHMMRKLYANYSYDTYAAKSITKPAWIQMVLGHLPTSFMSSLAYNTANVFDAVPQAEHPKEEFAYGELQAALKNARKLLQVSNADHLRSLFITDDHEVVKLELVSRGGYSHEERLAVFKERTEQMRRANIPRTTKNYKQLGFSHKYIKTQLSKKK